MTYVVVRVRDERLSLNNQVDETIDNPECVEMQVLGSLFLYASIGNLFVLLLEETEKSRTIVAGNNVSLLKYRTIHMQAIIIDAQDHKTHPP